MTRAKKVGAEVVDADDGDEWDDGADDGNGAAEWSAGDGDGDEWDEWGEDAEPAIEWTAEVDRDEVAALRTVRMVVVALVLVVVGLGAVALARAIDDEDGERVADNPVLGDITAVVGPPSGALVADYIAGQRADLADATGDRVAVVSLVSYRNAASVDELLGTIGGVEVEARLVALPGGAPIAVAEPLAEWVAGQREPLQAERDEIARIIPSIEDPDDPFIPGYNEELGRLDAQLASLDAGAELVSGVIVRGGADALRRLAERAEVRVVAVATDDDLDDLTLYRGLRPEELDRAGTPPTRPTPVPA